MNQRTLHFKKYKNERNVQILKEVNFLKSGKSQVSLVKEWQIYLHMSIKIKIDNNEYSQFKSGWLLLSFQLLQETLEYTVEFSSVKTGYIF